MGRISVVIGIVAFTEDAWLSPKSWTESKDGEAVHYVRAVIMNTNKAENGNIQQAA